MKWKLVYFTPPWQVGDRETLEVTGCPKQEPVRYAALNHIVDLLSDGELSLGEWTCRVAQSRILQSG